VLGGGIVAVGISEADTSATPQTPQKWFRSGFSAEQERHRAIETHSITGLRPVVMVTRPEHQDTSWQTRYADIGNPGSAREILARPSSGWGLCAVLPGDHPSEEEKKRCSEKSLRREAVAKLLGRVARVRAFWS
jgi:hypothetical protein